MLIEFSVENFLSFKERAVLSMVASSRDKSFRENVICSAQGTEFNLLKCAAIYGPNASGKSNFIEAMNLMEDIISQPAEVEKDFASKIIPFKPDPEYRKKPSTFEIFFLQEGVRYQYGFSLDSKVVHEEWLYSYPKKQQRLLFERLFIPEKKEFDYKFGSHWKGEKKRLEKLTRPNTLFISVANAFNNEIAINIIDWFNNFRNVSTFPVGRGEHSYTAQRAFEDEGFKTLVLDLLQKADIEISDFIIKTRPF